MEDTSCSQTYTHCTKATSFFCSCSYELRMRYCYTPYAAASTTIRAEPGFICSVFVLGTLPLHQVSDMNLTDGRRPRKRYGSHLNVKIRPTVLARIESPGALFFKLSLRGGTLFKRGHYSRGGFIISITHLAKQIKFSSFLTVPSILKSN